MKRIESKRASVTVGEQESGEKRAANVSEYRESIGPRVTLANKRPRSGSSLRPCSRHYLASFTAVKRGCRRRIAIVGPTHRYSPKQASVSKLHRARERDKEDRGLWDEACFRVHHRFWIYIRRKLDSRFVAPTTEPWETWRGELIVRSGSTADYSILFSRSISLIWRLNINMCK